MCSCSQPVFVIRPRAIIQNGVQHVEVLRIRIEPGVDVLGLGRDDVAICRARLLRLIETVVENLVVVGLTLVGADIHGRTGVALKACTACIERQPIGIATSVDRRAPRQ